MAAATSTESTDYSTEIFDCRTCAQPVFAKKDGPGCAGCPAFVDTHYFPRGEGHEAPDVLVLGDVPEAPALALMRRNENNSSFYHVVFTDDGGKSLKSAVEALQADVAGSDGKSQLSPYAALQVRYVYAVKCAVEKPNKDVVAACGTPLANELSRVAAARKQKGKTGPLIVLATGTVALKALGIAVKNFEDDAAGRVFENYEYGQIPMHVVATMSLKAMAAQAGKYSSIVADVQRAFDLVRGAAVKQKPRAEVEAGYAYPRTNAEVRRLVDEIVAYTEGSVPPDNWAIAFDTETNTLHPHRDGTKILSATFAWAEGKACSIPLYHPGLHDPLTVDAVDDNGEKYKKVVAPPVVDDDYDPDFAWEQVKRLLACPKPKIGYNIAKYDQKVVWKYGFDINNLKHDGLLFEHALEEDKKGQYGLKYQVKQWIPELSGYEDKLHEFLDAEEGEDQGTSIKSQAAAKEGERPLPKPVQEALDRCGLAPKFQAGSLEKQVAYVKSRLDQRAVVDQTVAFFARYDIAPPFKGKAFQKRWKAVQHKAAEVREKGLGLKGLEPVAEEFMASELALIDTLGQVEDLTFFEPLAGNEEQFLRDADLLLAAKRSGEFQKKTEKAAKKEQEGGFEKIPLHELNFYGAVDADATRRIAIIQRERVAAEDKRCYVKYAQVAAQVRHWRGPEARYKVERLCKEPAPLLAMHRDRYLPRARVLADMEFRGVRINKDYLRDAKIELDNVINRTTTKLYAMAGEEFNLNSPGKLGAHLFDTGVGFVHPDPAAAAEIATRDGFEDKVKWTGTRMMYRFVSKTKKGAPQLNEKTFRTYVTQYGCPFSDLILLYKKSIKARDTFLKNIELLSSLDGRIHTNFNLSGTSTGRLSSNNINLQNVPAKVLGAIVDREGQLILDASGSPVGPGVYCKRLFIPDDDSYVLVNADAKGAEVGIFSAYAKDKALIAALLDGMDAHCYFAAQTLNPDKIGGSLTGEQRRIALASASIDDEHAWSYEDFKLGNDGKHPDKAYGKRLKALRTNMKRVVFGILFGAGPAKIAEIAGIDERLASTIIKALFKEFASIPAFVEQTKWELRTFGFVETYHGRRRRFPWNPLTAPRKMLGKAERQAVNFKIQGTNSDLVLDVLVAMDRVVRNDLRGRMLLTVHDSLVFQVPRKYLSQVPDVMYEYGTKRVAQASPWLPIPYRWDVECGPSYGDLQPIAKYLAEMPRLSGLEHEQGLNEEEIEDEIREAIWQREDGEETAA
jgi:DNA polymerase I-like protein with 3'-5' exonuclease and polymerase domains